jgi:hypothetical protein
MEKFEVVIFNMWFSSGNEKASLLLRELSPFLKEFSRDQLKFVPAYVNYPWKSGTADYSKEHRDCLSGGRYCLTDPDDEGKLTGRDVLQEDLR